MKAKERIRKDRSTPQLGLIVVERICKNCGKNPVYMDNIQTMDWCENCIWLFVQEESTF